MKKDKYTPINILWIEDNPLQNAITGKLINERNGFEVFDKSYDDTPIPVIFFEADLKDEFKYFNLKILQHPEEIKEYISMCLQIEDNFGAGTLGNVPGIVPEMVIFDYKLSENIEINKDNKNIKYRNPTEAIRRYVNPNFVLRDQFKELFTEKKLYLENDELNEYSLEDFIKRINENDELDTQVLSKDANELGEDDLGLYSGIEIARLYRNHPCVGVPATFNKADKNRLHAFSKYYEWLNEYDLGSMFSRTERGSKEWESVIKDGVWQLRQRITVLMQSGKIIPSLSQLIELADGKIEERVFSFNSIYAERELPLDGLFIDVMKDLRNEAIIEWVKGKEGEEETKPGLLGILAKAANTNISEIKNTINKFTTIWDCYKSYFLLRFVLSHYIAVENTLSSIQKKVLSEIKETYCSTGENKFKDSFCCSVKLMYDEAKGKQKQKSNPLEIRLLILFLVTKLWIEHRKGLQNNTNALSDNTNLRLDKDDYYNVLNPIDNNSKGDAPVTLCKHSKLVTESAYMDSFQKWIKRLNAEIPETEWNNFKAWIKPGEKSIVKSLFMDDLNITGYPEWLY